MADKQYRRIISGCPICGKLCCKAYGYSKSDKKWIKRKTRTKLKKENKNDLLY